MYVAVVPNRGSAPAVLLRESYRDGNKVKNRTLQNLSHWPAEQIEALRAVLRGERLVPADEGLQIVRALPHGHVLAALGTARKIKLDRVLPRALDRRTNLALALIVARLLEPASKLATARGLDETTALSSLGPTLGLGRVRANEVYATLDWLGTAQPAIEASLAQRHLSDGVLVLYDVTSTWLEGRCCALARHGYSRDGRPDKLQIIVGLLCSAQGCPIAVEVFEGNTADPATLSLQVDKLKRRFGLSRVVLVGDRGMITAARIVEDLAPAGLDWLTALRAPAIQALAADRGPLQLSLFDQRDMAEIESPDYPGERLIVCRNPALAHERARKRRELLDATEQDLRAIQARVRRRRQPLRGADQIGLAVGAVMGRRKMAKHFHLTITDGQLSFTRDEAAIAAEAALDGIYVLRTNVPADSLSASDAVSTYKSLARVERAFRSLKTVDLELRPVFHWTAPRVRAHVLLCMLAYYLEWHMRQALAPMLFDDHDRAAADAARSSPVAKATPSPLAAGKAATKHTDEGLPVHSFRSLLGDLATLTRNTVRLGRNTTFALLATPTAVQRRALDLLGLKPAL
ncbi:MAG TPA: IS1634 family transposase [Ramlibacter sp.]|uniref:IS1634 family transposase n=1 Tax=Ramlibacter sp. TaxID=1917967 RepID=UPI002D8055DA|nr:IS1634 family transposase [Ramlibacter sp.]HET8746005.1 IS1634 family transposase [Ramlibacter sp.]